MDLLHDIVIPLGYCLLIFILLTFVISFWDALMGTVSNYVIHARERRMAQKLSKDAVKYFRDELEKAKSDKDFK